MATRDAFIRAYMAGVLLALSAGFAVSVAVRSGSALASAILFPVMFCMLYLMGFDLLTGVKHCVLFRWTPYRCVDHRALMAFIFTHGNRALEHRNG